MQAVEDDNTGPDLDDKIKLFAWMASYLIIILVMLLKYLQYRRERNAVKAELENF